MLNRILSSGIPLENVVRGDEGLFLTLPADALKRLRPLMKGCSCRVNVRRKGGLVCLRSRLRPMKVFLSSLLAASLVCAFLLSRIWFISVDSTFIPREDALSRLEALGVTAGMPKSGVKAGELAAEILRDPGIVNAKIAVRGVTLKVELSEMSGADPGEASPAAEGIYSSRDCVIRGVSVRSGRAAVKVGQAVKKGDLLITGDLSELKEGYRVPAEGMVTGEVLYTASATAPLLRPALVRSGRSVRAVSVEVMGAELFPEAPFAEYEKELLAVRILDSCPVPVTISEYELFELVWGELPDTYEGAAERARLMAQEKLLSQLSDEALILTAETLYEECVDGSIRATVTVTASENVGEG